MDSLFIVMPAYNEEANIENVIEKWYPVLKGKSEKSRLVIADSGSSDLTHSILMQLKNRYPQLDILDTKYKQHGPKLIALYKYSIDNDADYIFQTDSDGQTNPKEFEAFWDKRGSFDAVIGLRNKRGDGAVRAWVEKVVCLLLRIIFKVSVPDANAPFRLMKTSVVEKYLDRFEEDYNLPNIMLTTFFSFYRENITFGSISFKPRQGGKNSINIIKIFKIGVRAISDFRYFKKTMN